MIRAAAAVVALLAPTLAFATVSETTCAPQALQRAQALLEYHLGESAGVHVADVARPLPPLRNPRNRAQWFDVLEVDGFFYKGEYRLRLIYARDLDCALIGEEVLQIVDL